MSVRITCRCGQHRMDRTAYLTLSAVARTAFKVEIETCRGCDQVESKEARP